MVKKKPRTWGIVQKIRDLEGVGLFHRFENTLYIRHFTCKVLSHQFSSLHDQSLSLCIEDFISIALVDPAGLLLAGDVLTRLLRLLSGKMVDGDGEVLGEAQISGILEHTYTLDNDPSQGW